MLNCKFCPFKLRKFVQVGLKERCVTVMFSYLRVEMCADFSWCMSNYYSMLILTNNYHVFYEDSSGMTQWMCVDVHNDCRNLDVQISDPILQIMIQWMCEDVHNDCRNLDVQISDPSLPIMIQWLLLLVISVITAEMSIRWEWWSEIIS